MGLLHLSFHPVFRSFFRIFLLFFELTPLSQHSYIYSLLTNASTLTRSLLDTWF